MRMTADFTYPSIQQRKFFWRETAPIGEVVPGVESVRGRETSLKKRRASLSNLSDGELLKAVSRLRVTEKKIELSMLLYLVEVESRSLDLSMGYNSLFDFCTKRLKYSRSVAGRRIRVARAIRKFPEVYEYLSSGKTNICNISKVSEIMTKENYRQLIEQISGMSTREVEILVSEEKPATKIRDRVIPVKVFERVDQKEGVKGVQKTGAAGDSSPSGGSSRYNDLGRADSTSGNELGLTGDFNSRSDSTPGSMHSAVHRQPGDLFALSTEGSSFGAGGEAGGMVCGGKSGEMGGAKSESESADGPLRAKLIEIQKFKLQFAVSPEFMEKFERIKELMSTKTPRGASFEEAFETLMDEYIERHSPEAREKRREARAAKAKKIQPVEEKEITAISKQPAKAPERTSTKCPEIDPPIGSAEPSRHIPQAIRDNVFKRDGGKCMFKGPDGRICGSTWNLQVDHIKPFALGGSNSPENLQLLCRRHNQHKALKDFGKKKIHRQ